MSPVRLVARREVRERLRARSFRISLLVQLVLVVGLVLVARSLSGDGPDTVHLGAAGAGDVAVARAAQAGQGAAGLRIEVERLAAPDARRRVADGDLDAALAGGRLLVGDDPPGALVTLVQQARRVARQQARLRADGLDAARARAALAVPAPEVERVGGPGGGGEGVALLGSLFTYLTILTFGYIVAYGVVEEKSSRVVEVVLAGIRPVQLLAGKTLGIGVVGLMQVVAVAGVGLAASAAIGGTGLPDTTAATAGLVALYFVLGYAFYSFAFAAAASLVSRQEDVQNTSAPLALVLVGGYLASLAVIGDPHSTLATVGALVPPLAPMFVPVLAARDALGPAELALSLALMGVAIWLMALGAGRVYRRTILRTGAPVRLREALRGGRA